MIRTMVALLLAAAGICFAQDRPSTPTPAAENPPPTPSPSAEDRPTPPAHLRVLLVWNQQSGDSRRIADRYALRRSIPPRHQIALSLPEGEEMGLRNYRLEVESPVRDSIRARALADTIDFIVLTRGIPLRVREGGYAVDALLAVMDLALPLVRSRIPADLRVLDSPYFGARRPFRHPDEGFYLVTRLDGYTAEDAMLLIDRALAAQRASGPFLFDLDPARDRNGFQVINDSMRRAAWILGRRGFRVDLESGPGFHAGRDLAGYYSWGSNDGDFRAAVYRELTFVPGAIAETAVSTSGRTFLPSTRGQSLIADLIRQGVTGAKGYVSEPLALALCRADILFERYTGGFNLAESFFMASPLLSWKDIVVGDPLCAPYAEAEAPGASEPGAAVPGTSEPGASEPGAAQRIGNAQETIGR